MNPMLSRLKSVSSSCVAFERSFPRYSKVPEVAWSMPPMIFSNVDLPQPLSPSSTRNSPSYTSRFTPFSTLVTMSPFWNSRVMSRSSITTSPGCQGAVSASFSSMAMAAIMAMISITSAVSSLKHSLSMPFTNWMTPKSSALFENGTHTIDFTGMPMKSMAVSTSWSARNSYRRSAFCDSKTRPTAPSPSACDLRVRSTGPIQKYG